MTLLNVSDECGEDRRECEKNGGRVVIGAVLTTAEDRLIQVIQLPKYCRGARPLDKQPPKCRQEAAMPRTVIKQRHFGGDAS
ncbi:glycosyltransferase 1 domain-containing protein 1 [Platysternon megacephalum]|uniref:Glycosyltransferase 1 domain-containing protein 1 n=1 Tax=Platysternon megacephalum TaxID=55544 RepID=A0A4D9F4I8_9SAUR|nr:glycosyltransferase 1 domain-containing protein 1 [Platysternon megacephalum]